MKIKVSDYIADFFAVKNITQVFSVVGGGAMHLNDSFGHHPKMHCIYNHHEQACSMAAEGYAKITNKPAIVCVTSGPGSLNALTGVVGAYQDSVPMIVISGQVKSTLCIKSSGLNLRTIGGQEVDIVPAVQQNLVKYAVTIMDVKKLRYCLEKAYIIATTGRQGPCWLDVPLDIQGCYIETDELQSYNDVSFENEEVSDSIYETVIEKLKSAKRPVIYAGNGIRLANACSQFNELVNRLKIPVVTCWNSIDLIATDDSLYCGRAGNMGDRAGNFAVQNSDFLLCIGTRLGVYQVGWHVEKWAREAYTVVVDIDSEELKKKTIRADLPVCADAKDFIFAMLNKTKNVQINTAEWVNQCNTWKNKYPVVRKTQYSEKKITNVYAFIDTLSKSLPQNAVTVVSNGSASVVGSQTYYIKNNDRFLMNCAISSMGYGLPASIGACIANNKKDVVCVEGDGSLMMNLQELQTVATNELPIKLFVINNNGYHQIRQTQRNVFQNRFVGMGPESGDLSFPDFKKVAKAFGFPYYAIHNNSQVKSSVNKVLKEKSFVFCEVFVSAFQNFEPKSATKKLDNGTLVSPPLEDMAPFLSRKELEDNMYVSVLPEE